MCPLTRVKQKEIMLEYNKNYTTLALNYVLKNSKRTISVLKIERRSRKNNIKKIRTYKTLKRALLNAK